MGNQPANLDILYAVPSNPSSAAPLGETPVLRSPKNEGKDLVSTYGGKTIHELYRNRFDKVPDDNGFARRVYDPVQKVYTNEVEWFTNRQFREQAEAIGSGLINLRLVPEINEWNNMTLKFAGLYSKNTLEYLLFDVACTMYGVTVVPIYDTLGEEATLFAFNQTKMETCALTANHVGPILKLKQGTSFQYLRNLIVMDPQNLTADLEESSRVNGIKLIRWDELAARGREQLHPWAKVTPQSIYAFSYTSGTTGEPKAAMLSHQNMTATSFALHDVVEPQPGDAYLSYLPMAHVMERLIINGCIFFNVTIGIYSGDVLKLKEDLAVFKPTLFVSVPRLFNRFYDAILSGIKEKSGLAKAIFKRGLATKKDNLKSCSSYDHWLYDKIVFNKLKAVLGGRVRLMVTGSAPIAPEVLDFLKVAFCSRLLEGYGQTEGTALEFITAGNDPDAGHVGGPSLVNEFKLVDIPEMNYTSRDVDEFGKPAPRGEIWVRGPNIIPGYYKQDEKNMETFTSDGWMKSGDVGMIYSDHKRLKIIDRKKNIFKLAQGEYIAPEKLENIYKLAHPSVAAVWVYGDSLKSCLIGVVNMERPALVKFAQQNGIPGEDADQLARDPAIKKRLLEQFDKLAKEKKLNSLEKLKDIYIEVESFQNLGLLTEAFKVKRVDIRTHYKKTLDDMYAQLG
jgi:long-chain acyl-CoA synthetase